MARPILLRFSAEPDGSSRVSVGDGHTRTIEGVWPADAGRALRAAVSSRLSPLPRVLFPGEDAARSRAEDEVGGLLLDTLRVSPAPFGRLCELLGQATGQGEPARLVVDGAPDLPWELLATAEGAPPLEAAEGGVLARLVAGQPAHPPRVGPLTIRVWSPTPGDPTCQRLLAHLMGEGRALGVAVAPLDVADPLPAATEGPEILHVICHGRRDLDAVVVQLGQGDAGASAAAARLGPLLRRIESAVLAVCAGGDATPREIDSLAGRLASLGARSVLAPRQRVSAEALERFSAGFYGGLAAGQPLARAVIEGRRAVRAWAHPHPQCRWSNLAWFVSDAGVLDSAAMVPRVPLPKGWPRPQPEVLPLLEAVAEPAARDGFLGFEHLLSALPRVTGGGDVAGWLRRACPPRVERFLAALSQLSPQPGITAPAPPLTPRLTALGAKLPPDFNLEALALQLSADADLALGLFGSIMNSSSSDGDPYATLESLPPDELPLAEGLVVLGGPEDGRRLSPAPGDTVGRVSDTSGPHHGLYAGTALWDRKLSREHLRWLGRGTVFALRAVTRLRSGEEEVYVGAPIEVRQGDQLLLTPSTRLVAVARS